MLEESARVLQEGNTWEVYLPSNFTGEVVSKLWKQLSLEKSAEPHTIRFFAQGIRKTDSSGISLLHFWKKKQEANGKQFELLNLPQAYQFLYQVACQNFPVSGAPKVKYNQGELVGKWAILQMQKTLELISFTGELTIAFFSSLRRPSSIRWNDAFKVAEAMGVNAFPIIALIGFLLGLIMSFQSTIPMRRFGAEIFVANLVGLSLFRELGPLMTAFILSGRSGSAFAAEIGTMKVSEEIDALTTMGLPPTQFLIIPRVIAALAMTPLLTVVFNFFGLLGGAIVLHSFGFPFVTFINQVNIAVGFNDIMGGMVKSLFFGLVIAGIGCYEGLKTSLGAGAVGESTTAAVVGSIILVSILDGIFSVTFFYIGI